MSSNIPDFDPYLVLGVDKKSSASEIKTAYRKLVLKTHPDKIQDEALRAQASDEFQKVQESYEILTDERRRQLYDQQVLLASLRKEVNTQNSSRAASSREYRDGRMYEERVPAGAAFFNDSDEPQYADEPLFYSHKYDDSTKRAHTKVAEEKRKAKSVPLSSSRTTRQSEREYAKSTHHDRAKNRTKERRHNINDKYERTTASYTFTEADDLSDSDGEVVYTYRVKRSNDATRESVPRRSKNDPVTSQRYRRRHLDSESESDGDDYEHDLEFKYDSQQNYVKEYINRTREPETDRRHRPSRSYPEYDSHRYERESSRYSSRAYTRGEETRVPASSPRRTSRRSHDRLASPVRGFERGASSTTSPPKVSSSRGPPPIIRSSTAPFPRTRREGSSRSESNVMSTLTNMVAGVTMENVLPSKPRPRGAERYDSGYSSGPGTPEMSQGTSSVPKVSRFIVVEPSEQEPETIVREPADVRYHSSSSPPRADRERSSASSRTPKSSRTYAYEPEIRMARPAAASKSSSSRQHFTDVRYAPEITLEGRRFQRRQTAY